tara:strand:- start:1373 stop:1888 length:516 start_codon:yes stop_codon:yes gene_type:complete
MRKLTIPRLKVISDRWVNERRRIVKEGKPFLISIDLIKENLYYKLHYESEDPGDCITCDDLTEDGVHTYNTLYNEIKKNGWNTDYPASIIIGTKGEVYYGNGNHRLNMVINYIPEIKEIPVCIQCIPHSPYCVDITYRWHRYEDKVNLGIPNYSPLGYYRATAKFPKWRNK